MPDYITRTELQRMVDACDPTTLAGKRDRLLLVVLRALGGRSGEVVWLRDGDVELMDGGGIGGLVLHRSTGTVDVPSGEFTDHDPSSLFFSWYAAFPLDTWRDERPLFRAISKDDRPIGTRGLTPWAINQIVKRAAARAGLDNPERYTARIMRGPVRRKVRQ